MEQNIDFAMSVAEECYIMDKGTIVAHQNKAELNNLDIVKKYLASMICLNLTLFFI